MKPDDIKPHLEELYSYAKPRIMDHLDLDGTLASTVSEALKSGGPSETSSKHELTWLIGILRKQIREHYQEKYRSEEAVAKARHAAKEILDCEFDIPKKLAGLDSNLLSHADNPTFWAAFNECVGMLNEVQAEVFILRDLEDVSVEEVCGIFGLSRNDVLELVYRARMTTIACVVKSLESGK